jgi:hypothetical protein
LAHTAAELVRVILHADLGRGYMDAPQAVDHPVELRLAGQLLVETDGLSYLILDGKHGVEAGERVLQDDGDAAAADAPHLPFRLLEQVLPGKANLSANDPGCRLGSEPQDRESRHRLAASRLSDKPEAFAAVEVEAHAVNGLIDASPRVDVRAQIVDFKQSHVD